MSVCLCNLSADTILEMMAQNGVEPEPANPDFATFSADAETATMLLGSFVHELPKPIELLVGRAQDRRHAAEIACHVWRGSVPDGSILRLSEGVYVTSPELTLLQQASSLHQASLCQMLGRYLGTWTPKDDGQLGQQERMPLTTFERLNGFIAGVGRARGVANLRLAMAYTCEGAASRPETTLQLVMSLPSGLSGLALPQPYMNYRVDLTSLGRRICGKESIRIDLCWPDAHFGLEYQGQEHGKTLGDDYARWYAARDAGYELWFIAKEQLESSTQMGHIGREVAKRLGVAVDELLWPSEIELQELLETLLGRRNPKPISAAELRRRMAAARR